MNGQLSFASLDFGAKKKRTKRDVFLVEMATIVHWATREAVIEAHYIELWDPLNSTPVEGN
jgi:transposase, IS5 family